MKTYIFEVRIDHTSNLEYPQYITIPIDALSAHEALGILDVIIADELALHEDTDELTFKETLTEVQLDTEEL